MFAFATTTPSAGGKLVDAAGKPLAGKLLSLSADQRALLRLK